MKQALVPVEAAKAMGLSIPLNPETWIADRKQRLENGLIRLAAAVRNGTLAGGVIKDGTLRLDANVPEEAGDLVLDLYRRLPEARITDILIDVDRQRHRIHRSVQPFAHRCTLPRQSRVTERGSGREAQSWPQ